MNAKDFQLHNHHLAQLRREADMARLAAVARPNQRRADTFYRQMRTALGRTLIETGYALLGRRDDTASATQQIVYRG